MIYELLLLQRAPEKQRRMWFAMGHAIEPIAHAARGARASVDRLDHQAGPCRVGCGQNAPRSQRARGINLPTWRRAALRNDYEHLLECLVAQVSNTAGAGDLTALSAAWTLHGWGHSEQAQEQTEHGLSEQQLTAWLAYLRDGKLLNDRFWPLARTRKASVASSASEQHSAWKAHATGVSATLCLQRSSRSSPYP